MSTEERYADIRMARVSFCANNLVEVRIRPDARIDVVGLRMAMHLRREALGGQKGAIFFLAIGDLDWEPAALQTDLFGEDGENITAFGVLVDNKVLALAANMYFGLFPAAFPTKISNSEAEIRTWLAGY